MPKLKKKVRKQLRKQRVQVIVHLPNREAFDKAWLEAFERILKPALTGMGGL